MRAASGVNCSAFTPQMRCRAAVRCSSVHAARLRLRPYEGNAGDDGHYETDAPRPDSMGPCQDPDEPDRLRSECAAEYEAICSGERSFDLEHEPSPTRSAQAHRWFTGQLAQRFVASTRACVLAGPWRLP
jgi:hypothetical protein